MCEVLERKDQRQNIPYESDADKIAEEIVEGLMDITALSLGDSLADKPAMNEGLKKGNIVLAPLSYLTSRKVDAHRSSA